MRRVLASAAAFSRDLTDGFQPAGLAGQSLLSSVTCPGIRRDHPKQAACCTQHEPHALAVIPTLSDGGGRQRRGARWPKRRTRKVEGVEGEFLYDLGWMLCYRRQEVSRSAAGSGSSCQAELQPSFKEPLPLLPQLSQFAQSERAGPGRRRCGSLPPSSGAAGNSRQLTRLSPRLQPPAKTRRRKTRGRGEQGPQQPAERPRWGRG